MFKKGIKIAAVVIVAIVLVIQFVTPEKNVSNDNSRHITETEALPENIKSLLSNSCFDCHSDNTNYKWYHKPAPVSWMIRKHIDDGKEELNFSEWGDFDIFKKITTLEEICKETERKTMPLKSYTLMHSEARLSDEQIAEICAWTESFSMKLLSEVNE